MMDEKEKRLAKAVEAALDSAVQTSDPAKRKSQLERALKYVRRLLPASKWGGELSLLRYRVGDPKKNEETSKTNFREWRKHHLRKDQKQLNLWFFSPAQAYESDAYTALHEELSTCNKCGRDTDPIQFKPNWKTDFTKMPPETSGEMGFTLSCPHCGTELGQCDMNLHLLKVRARITICT